MVTLVKLEQKENAKDPMLATLLGIVTLVRPVFAKRAVSDGSDTVGNGDIGQEAVTVKRIAPDADDDQATD
jgi:hypothetical protein